MWWMRLDHSRTREDTLRFTWVKKIKIEKPFGLQHIRRAVNEEEVPCDSIAGSKLNWKSEKSLDYMKFNA